MSKAEGLSRDEHTIAEHRIKTADGLHTLYVQEWGNPRGTPILYVHGGPGGGCSNKHKRVFDSKSQRVIFFDQRGSGNSKPSGSLKNNTTPDLIDDIDRILKHLKIDNFIILGGSWGSYLAMLYAIKHPKKVRAMILSGIYTGTQAETDWLLEGKFKDFYPEVWENYLSQTPEPHRANPSSYHLKSILGQNKKKAIESAKAFGTMDGSVMSLDDRMYIDYDEDFDGVVQKIEAHYFTNDLFMPEDYITKNASSLAMPIWLLQGRYDMVCPPKTAYELDKILPDSKLAWYVGGHKSERESWNLARTILIQLCRK